MFDWLATAPLGASAVLADELRAFGASAVRERSSDVKFTGSLELGLRVCLWSRAVGRVFLQLASVDASSSAQLYAGAKAIDWRQHFAPGKTLACECSGGNDAIKHTVYGSQLLKDAVCDNLREATGERPNVQPRRPDVPLHLHVEGAQANISIDFAGESLHRRGYRLEGGRAPLRENVAAAVLLRAGWPGIYAAGGGLVDPMCGSGTFLIEAALIAADAAPGLHRDYYGFSGWLGHDKKLWAELCAEAEARRAASTPRRCIQGSDHDTVAVRMTQDNAARAGMQDWIHVEKRALDTVPPPALPVGLLVTNPPYGERIGHEEELPALYASLGGLMREQFAGWQAAVLTGNPPLARHLGVYAERTHRVANGPIECRLLRFDLAAPRVQRSAAEVRIDWAARPGAVMFANRLRKNLQKLDAWARRESIECFRVYDADMPEYSFAIDIYGRDPRHLYVQEYAAPKSVDADKARDRRREALAVLPDVFAVPMAHIHVRVRKQQKGIEQYEKQENSGQRLAVAEGGLKFWVNFQDYLDTGLFLDHRLIRDYLRAQAQGADFLNLFCYTGTATVYAAVGGAKSTLSIDLSNTYLDWAHDNLVLNGLWGDRHRLLREDCLKWLTAAATEPARFDLIFLDPPTFSNSKRMDGVLDVQRDHVELIHGAMRLLRAGGQLVFSTNYTRFKLAAEELREFSVTDITAKTVSKDFERNAKLHRCYTVTPIPSPADGAALRTAR
jgi:23S rRNA (guanine2445-N2)-methyltransferase / 23S rRNA (guanine2069-N7)-methyltransferase